VLGPTEKILPGHPSIAYLSQQFELRNHYRVEELLSYANKLSHNKAKEIFELCRISHLLQRKNVQLSGGERQRIALARLLVGLPELLLLDEPFSNLDAFHTGIMKEVLHDITLQLGITCLLVSHDARDTLPWADEIIVLQNGSIVQKATPYNTYHQPANEYVAGLFGAYNLLDSEVAKRLFSITPADESRNLFLRPEELQLSTGGDEAPNCRVEGVYYHGMYQMVTVLAEDTSLKVLADSRITVSAGDRLRVTLKSKHNDTKKLMHWYI
jgi:ABC-type sugar transport system ATPase subunit